MEFRNREGRRSSPSSIFLTCSGNRRSHGCDNKARFPYHALERLTLDWVTDIKVTDADAALAGATAVKLIAKEAERNDVKRRRDSAYAKWENETDDALRDMLYVSIQRHSAALPVIDKEISELSDLVRATQSSVIDDRRASVKRLRVEMAHFEGEALFEMRAKLAAALRQVIDHIYFEQNHVFSVTLKAGLKLYRFGEEGYLGAFDLNDANPDGADKLLTYPSAETIDALKLHPMTVAGIRDTLSEFVTADQRRPHQS
jgi:hypothetical protein